MLKRRARQLGQGMTEYIVIVALVAVSAIAVYIIFGDVIRGQVGDLAAELGGGDSANTAAAEGAAAQAAGTAEFNLGNFQQDENQ